jgi:hypothetical protein
LSWESFGEQPQVGCDDRAERHRGGEQVSEDQEHVQQGNGFPGKVAAERESSPGKTHGPMQGKDRPLQPFFRERFVIC